MQTASIVGVMMACRLIKYLQKYSNIALRTELIRRATSSEQSFGRECKPWQLFLRHSRSRALPTLLDMEEQWDERPIIATDRTEAWSCRHQRPDVMASLPENLACL